MNTIAISQETLLSLPIDALIALYNAESKHLAHGLEPHTVDATCKPLYIVKLMAKLPIRYAMQAEQESNERAAMRPVIEEEELAESKPTKASREAESRRENAALNGTRTFTVLR